MELSRDSKYALSVMDSINHYFGERLNTPNFPQYPSSLDHVRAELEQRLSQDNQYMRGKVLGAMSTPPHPFASEIYSKYIDRNLGDRGLNPATSAIEHEVISMIGNLLHGQNIVGNLTSGGTESNIIAMFLAKQNAIHNEKKLNHPNIIIPESAHYSFTKAAMMMDLEIRKAPLLPNHQVNVEKVSDLIDKHTIALVGVAGTSSLGVVDPIAKARAKIALENNLHFHVDGAFGGLVLPYLEDLGYYNGPIYDFRIDGIDTYTVDPHKMGMNVNPTGGLLINPKRLKLHSFSIPYLAGGGVESFNILGTRPGASAISFWALIQALGFTGFRDIIKACWQVTQYANKKLKTISTLDVLQDPTMNILGIHPSKDSKFSLNELNTKIRQEGWALGNFQSERLLRLVMMPHVSQLHIDSFLETLMNFH